MSEQHKSHVYTWENWKTARHGDWSHQKAREFADQHSDPILDPLGYTRIYWQVLSGFGWVPYRPGGTQ